MSKINFPESIKSALAVIDPLTSSLKGYQFPINLGRNEVLVLLGFDYSVVGNIASGTNRIEFGIYRKSDRLPDGDWIFANISNQDIVWSRCHQHYWTTGNSRSSWSEMIHLPYPVVLIRPPQLCALADVFDSGIIEMRIYYLVAKASDTELAELMVKDHA